MKKWTVVIEITDDGINDNDDEIDPHFTKNAIEACIVNPDIPAGICYRIMECIEAPYGPQHPDGVFLADSGRKGNFRQ